MKMELGKALKAEPQAEVPSPKVDTTFITATGTCNPGETHQVQFGGYLMVITENDFGGVNWVVMEQ